MFLLTVGMVIFTTSVALAVVILDVHARRTSVDESASSAPVSAPASPSADQGRH